MKNPSLEGVDSTSSRVTMTTTMNHKGEMTLNKKLLSLLLVAFISLLAACSDDGEAGENTDEKAKEEQASGEQGEQAEQPEMPEPNLEGIPDVVAQVNGDEISKEEFTSTYESQFQQAAMQSQMTGKEVDQDQLKKQVAENLVSQQLLIQEANNRDFTVTDEEKNAELEELAKQQQLESKDKLLSALEEQGMGQEEVMAQLEKQLKLEKLIAAESGEGDLQPTKEEIQQAYDQYKSQQEEANPEAEVAPLEEIKPNIEQQLVQQKEAQVYQTLIESLREDAEVTVNL